LPRWKKYLYGFFLITLTLVVIGISRVVCLPAIVEYGVFLEHCPVGKVHPALEVDATSLRRGQFGDVRVEAFAWWTGGATDSARTFVFPDVEPKLTLWRVGAEGDEAMSLEIDEKKGWKEQGRARVARVKLPPDLLDGDYKLRAQAKTRAGDVQIEVPLAVYAPAKVHVLTDRPLYEPGNTIKFRSVVLRARDLAPLDGRPGTWKVIDPSGTTVLEERSPAGPWGVAAGELPLDDSAPTGGWRVRWESAGASAEARVRVEPFTLPRFTVDVASVREFYAAGEEPTARVTVTYSSGVPVRDARVELRWRFGGAWPPPPAYEAALPTSATTDKQGRVELTLPAVPEDIRGRVTLSLGVDAIDPAGDRAAGAGQLLLVEDKIQVSAVTELQGGLVEGFNNRLYIRATSASGAPLRDVMLRVKRAWDASDDGAELKTDADGVAVMQIDPGPAVNVVVPPMPVRPPPPPEPVERLSAEERVRADSPRLKDQVALDGWNKSFAPCARYVEGSEDIELTVRVGADGGVGRIAAEGAAARCVAKIASGLSLPAGPERLLDLRYRLRSDLASLRPDVQGDLPEGASEQLEVALRDARGCLGRLADEVSMPRAFIYTVEGTALRLEPIADKNAEPPRLAPEKARCVSARLEAWARGLKLRAPSEDDDPRPDVMFGVLRLEVEPVASVRAIKPQATTFLGYELKVEAFSDDEELGDTKLTLRPGSVPALRARAEPVIATAGQKVKLELLRGPDFDGELPEKVHLRHEKKTLEGELDKKTRAVTFELPADLDGWWEYEVLGARARVFVMPKAALDVSLSSDRPAYKPGDVAKLSVQTNEAGKGVAAAVTLVGVDETLGTLAPLPGPDAMDGLRPTPTMTRRAFDALDAAALIRGQIRGEHARAATALMVSRLPTYAELDAYVSGSARTELDPLPPLVDHFYDILDELYAQTRAWEASAKAGEQMTPERMVDLWDAAIDAVKARGGAVTDIFERELELALLPEDLLQLADPRVVVADGTRLPEDVENWVRWVRRNAS
jgi:hypothetical protein